MNESETDLNGIMPRIFIPGNTEWAYASIIEIRIRQYIKDKMPWKFIPGKRTMPRNFIPGNTE